MNDRLLRGVGVSPGIAIGRAVVVQSALPDVPHRVVRASQVEKRSAGCARRCATCRSMCRT
jgi:phosphoenolpyruvate-protein kinase (PTS system EI component)